MDALKQRVLCALNVERLAQTLHEISSHSPNNKAAELNVKSKLGHPATNENQQLE